MRNVSEAPWLSVCALLALAGCGPGSGGSCGNTAACGGDLMAKWTITSSCLGGDVSMFSADCPAATSTVATYEITGDVTYNADLSYKRNQTVSGHVSVTLPASCLTKQGVPQTCTQATQSLMADPTFTSVTCADAGSGACRCMVAFAEPASPQTGTYTTTAAGLVSETAAGTASASDYCVKGTTLTESPHQGAVTNMGTLSGTIVLTGS